MTEELKDKLIINGFGYLIKKLEKVKPHNANQMAGGIQLVFDNWDCYPNGGIIFDIINYLKDKVKKD